MRQVLPAQLSPGRSQWLRGQRRRSAAVRLLRLWVRIPLWAWMSVCCECCVLSARGLCDELITRPEESNWLWCVVVCDLGTSWMRRPWPTAWLLRQKQNWVQRIKCAAKASSPLCPDNFPVYYPITKGSWYNVLTENCDVLGFYAVGGGNFLPTYRSLLQGSKSKIYFAAEVLNNATCWRVYIIKFEFQKQTIESRTQSKHANWNWHLKA